MYIKAHLQARICTLLRVNKPSESIPHEVSYQWLHDIAVKLLPDTDAIDLKRSSASLSPHIPPHGIPVCRFEVIRWENGPAVITHWKLWLPRFIATGCKNYSVESVHLLTKICADLPKHLSYIAVHNRTVNVEGKPGRGKPIDQMTEHYIL